MDKSAFSEVIESSLKQWVAHCWQWDEFPNAGTLVVIDEGKQRLFGLIRIIETGSLDPTRAPFAYHKTEEELQRIHPEIFSFLRTTCTCVCVGFCGGEGPMLYHQPPRPPKIHAFTRSSSQDEQALFFSSNDYLLMLARQLSPEEFDDLLLAVANQYHAYFSSQDEQTLAFFETYAHLINHDYARLRTMASRVEKIVATKQGH